MEQILLSLICGVSIGATAGYLGTLMLSKRMSLVAGPLGHLTLPGITLALIFGFDVSLGAFPFVILGIFLIWLFERKTKLPLEALTAIVFATGVSISLLFLPIEKAEEALIGDISKVKFLDTLITFLLCLFVFLLTKSIYKKMVLISISEDLAKSEKIDVKKYNFLYLLCIAIIVALGVKVVGGLLTAALVAIPAASARNLSKNLFWYSFYGILFGILSSLFGIFFYKIFNISAGPTIILVNFFIFLVSLIFKK